MKPNATCSAIHDLIGAASDEVVTEKPVRRWDAVARWEEADEIIICVLFFGQVLGETVGGIAGETG